MPVIMSTGDTPRQPAHRLGRVLLGSVVAALIAVVAGPAGVALGAVSVTILSPQNGSASKNPTPSFVVPVALEGFEFPESVKVTVSLYRGATIEAGALVEKLEPPELSSLPAILEVQAGHLPDGTYTAQAEQTSTLFEGTKETTSSSSVTFTVDATPPSVTLTSPANGSSTTNVSPVVSGSAGTAPGDLPTVTAELFPGSTAGPQAAIGAVSVPVIAGAWSAPFGGLAPGTYTALALQSDEVGNQGLSAPVTFTILAPPPPPTIPPPSASFTWFPLAPRTGENVAIVSSSTDLASPITGFAWSLAGSGAFQAGKPLVTTSFTTPGNHVVRLRVTAASGASSIATETIPVSSVPLVLMQPFPIVRIAGSETSSGVTLRLLSAQAPAGSRITVTCSGHGCPAKSESRLAVSSSKKKGGAVVVEFRRFERGLKAGVVLEIRISKPGMIGKFTRFTVRHGKLPERGDACLAPSAVKPIVCPST
jgi:hypothetical protein